MLFRVLSKFSFKTLVELLLESNEVIGPRTVEKKPSGDPIHQFLPIDEFGDYDDQGRIVRADCVIPTTQSNANVHYDIQELAKEYALRGTNDVELERLCSMLVRAYDPYISCSLH